MQCLAIVCCLVEAFVVSLATSTYIVREFTDTENLGIFNHVVVNKNTGLIYLGAVNKIYKMSPDLTLESSFQTGPQKDNPDCYPRTPWECPTLTLMDNYNKVLIIDYDSSPQKLIACSNLFHGFCEKRDLQNISQEDTNTIEPVVANDQTSSTVAFIAPGPSPDEGGPQSNVMYVGATWTNVGLKAYRDLVPAFSSRKLTDFKIFYKSWSANSRQEIETQQRNRFPVKYIFGFSSDNYSYMLTVQRENTHSHDYISKVIRICQNDKRYHSYAEVPLNCTGTKQGSTTLYNIVQAATVESAGTDLAQSLNIPTSEDVLYAVFSKGESRSSNPTGDSALCMFPLSQIRKNFKDNIEKCFRGEGNTGPDHIIRPSPCAKSRFTITDNYCGEYDINRPIDGRLPIVQEAVLVFPPNTPVSAVAISITHDYTVAFVGLRNGHVKKVAIESNVLAQEYDDIIVAEGSPVSADMTFDLERKHLYVMTERKLSKLKVQDCNRYVTCNECLGANDPYCGWCSLENRCSVRTECREPEVQLRWLPFSGKQCTTITRIVPDRVQIERDHTTKLTLKIQNLPPLSGLYQCAFSRGETKLTTLATRQNDGVQCETPITSDLPDLPLNSDHIVMSLSVRMNGQDFVSRNLTFFNCAVHTHCTECTQSLFPCTWCIRNHMCTRHSENCLADQLVTGQSNPGNSDSPGPANCPRIEASFNNILVPSSTRKVISVKAINLKPFQTDLKCFFNMQSLQRQVSALSVGNGVIECESVEFSYFGDTDETRNVPFQITWGNNFALDNPTSIQVIMYKCNALADSCGTCLTMEEKYNCGWCDNTCTIKSQCRESWLPSTSTCPNPQIFQIIPTLGPLSGGTNLTILGENLGKMFSDIVGGVSVAGVPCTPYADLYDPAKRIVCRTGPISSPIAAAVRVRVAGRYNTQSADKFRYVAPKITAIHPKIGPKAGGTKLTITGLYMDAGSKREARVLQQPCYVIRFSANEIVCETSQAPQVKAGYVALLFDESNDTLRFEKEFFKFVDDPTIVESLEKNKRSIVSGGLALDFNGTNFDAIQEPKLLFWVGNESFTGDCTHKDQAGRQLNCSTPSLTGADLSLPMSISYGFKMDNAKNLLNLSQSDVYGSFIIYPDPSFSPFRDGIFVHRKNSEYLTINGVNILPGVDKPDVRVVVGMGQCNVTSVAKTQLTCIPPQTQPAALSGNGYPEVFIHVGNRNYSLGLLKYEEPEILSTPAKIGLAAGGGVILLIIVVFLIMYYVKSQESDTMLKRYQNQMDQLSMKVAKECKEAFAELQTDMTELTSDLYGQVAIPFWDYRTFSMHVLFPNDEQHAVMRELEVEVAKKDHVDKGLKLFAQLMNNKTFLLTFIRTLETNKDFSMRDRVNVASLISVALQSKMEYSTDILKTLLAELIEKSVEGKNHPKLLLRRTESVAEKMLTNWFTFLLYRFLKECAGEPLFLLYQAMKQQVSKGPVDAITSEARYALGEDKLIRQQVEYRQMTVYVMDIDAQFGQQEHPVRVLDCDTISQVKEKILDAIYKNAPFSSRPTKEDLDLEWNRGPQGKLILQEEDGTSKNEGDYKRLNTLAHYKVPDSSYLALVAKQSSIYNLSLMSDKSNKYDNLSYYNTRSPSLARTVSPQAIYVDVDKDKDTKCYHLVKPHDSESHKEGDRGSKMVSEVYLTRLLKTKGTLQQFVDDLLDTIFSTTHRGSALPLAIKYMFDFLDDQALHHNIQDPEVVHTWKSNSLPLRFWVNVIKNPNFVFDIYKSNIVDSCLSVVAQTFMDSCSMREHRLGINSPSSKLLYAQDIPKYKKWVERYYQDIKMMPAISDQDMNAMLNEESRNHQMDFNCDAALYELYKYVCSYNEGLLSALEEDEFARKNKLSYKLDQVHAAMEGEVSFC